MKPGIPLAWRQLLKEKKRLAAATSGIMFAVILMLVQLGFQDALMASAGLHAEALGSDIILASPQYQYLLESDNFPERRLYQAAVHPLVRSVARLYIGFLPWKNPVTRVGRSILVLGVPPRHGVFSLASIDDNIEKLRDPNTVLFDSRGRPEYGPIARTLAEGRPMATEILNRRVVVGGLFNIGTTFGVDGTVVVSDAGLMRMQPGRDPGAVTLGLIRLKPGASAVLVRDELGRMLPPDVRVYTRRGFIEHEQQYWTANTPVGFIFKLGVGMGLAVGLVIVYQILYTDVMDHLEEYATLKAIGFTDGYLSMVVCQEGVILSVFGFLPGAAISTITYHAAAAATFLPLAMTGQRLITVYAFTAAMCLAAAGLALRPVRRVDPAEIL
jgi:putative ABC transport system permease protein